MADTRPTTLHELLDAHGIELHDIPRPGGRDHGGPRSKMECPQCGGGRAKERNFYVHIDSDGAGATWACHRASCGFVGGGRIADAPTLTQRAARSYRRPAYPEDRAQPDTMLAYFASFGIDADTVEHFGIFRTSRAMPVIDRDGRQTKETRRRDVLAYPYVDDGELMNIKYKAVYVRGETTHKRFSQEAQARPTLFNIDAFTSPETDGIFVEGEDDVLAMWQAGFRQVTTLVDGSPSKLAASYDPLTDDDQRYVALRDEPRLDKLKRILLAGDMDEAGVRHHEEIARRVGKARCWLVRWPNGCKDAKDTLRLRGIEGVIHAVDRAEPYPLDGVRMPDEEAIANLHAGIHTRRIITGQVALDERVSLTDEGQFIVTTGIPGHGKTSFWTAMSVLYAESTEAAMKQDRLLRPFHTVVCSVETKLVRLAADIIAQYARLPFYPHDYVARVGLPEVNGTYLPWVKQHYSFIQWPDRGTSPPVSWLLERVRDVVCRTGAKLVILDPWQEFDDEMPDRYPKSPSHWIGKVLQRLTALAYELGTNIVLIVHPMKQRRHEGKFPIPGGYDIAESQNFYSRPDIGLTIHRPDPKSDDMLVRTWKSKDFRLGRVGDTTVRFDQTTTRIWPKPVSVGFGSIGPAGKFATNRDD